MSPVEFTFLRAPRDALSRAGSTAKSAWQRRGPAFSAISAATLARVAELDRDALAEHPDEEEQEDEEDARDDEDDDNESGASGSSELSALHACSADLLALSSSSFC